MQAFKVPCTEQCHLPMHLPSLKRGKNISSDCANTQVAGFTVPACAMVLPSEVMKDTCLVLVVVLNKLPYYLKNSALLYDLCLAPIGFNG
jgi:hypothetical protein